MKLLAFTDFHLSPIAMRRIHAAARKHRPDYLLCAGDMTIFEHNLEWVLRKLNEMPAKTILIPGNHEEGPHFHKACKRHKNLIDIDRSSYRDGKYLFLGFGGGGFSFTDPAFRPWAEKARKLIRKGDIIVLLTHQPPYGTRVDRIVRYPCGSKDIRRFIEKNPVRLAVSGHLHENFGVKDRLGKTILLNPGPYGTIIDI